MLKPAVTLDAAMTAAAVIERLAMQGFWIEPAQPAARARLEALSARLARPIDEVERRLVHDAHKFGAAIRRQRGTMVLWYARELQEVLERCATAGPRGALIDVLNLRESDTQPTIHLRRGGETVLSYGVVMDNGEPVAVSLITDFRSTRASFDREFAAAVGSPASPALTRSASEASAGLAPAVQEKQAWPRIEAPAFAQSLQPFEVVVGFGAGRQLAVAGGPVMLETVPGVETIDVTVNLSTGDAVRAPRGWSRTMRVPINNVLSAEARFELICDEPATPDIPYLTMLEVRYVLDGVVCGTAARPLVIVGSKSKPPASRSAGGDDWQGLSSASPFILGVDEHAPDLTIEILKPDRNSSSGDYVCQWYSPHVITAARGPFPMYLGQDAKTFAKAIVEEIRLFASHELLDMTLESLGRLVAQRLPAPVFDALREAAAQTAPAPPAVLIVSAEPYVPWELAWVEPALCNERPRYLGAQALIGRWLRDANTATTPSTVAIVPRPAAHPNATLSVRHMAVMAAWYKAQSGLVRLRMAEAEAKAIAEGWDGLALAASPQSMRQLLERNLEHDFEHIGGVEAVHFAGHGDFDPARPEGSALFLADGTPVRSTMFRAAKYGGEQQPLLFLNACMLGIGGEVLGDMAGFPGNSLRGGFGGVIGALWEVDDTVAYDFALEFWTRALPASPTRGEAVGSILRELRAKYVTTAVPAPISTYLAYVYYGHPRLTLQRAAP